MVNDFINCYKALCEYWGIEVNLPPMNVIEALGDPVEEILYLSDIRHKEVTLQKKWWKYNNGALLGKLKDGTPVGILPHTISGYRLYNPKNNTTTKISAKNAIDIDSCAIAVFRTFPAQHIKIGRLAQFMHRENLYKEAIIILLCSLAASIIQVIPAILSEEVFNTIVPGNMRGLLIEIVLILIIFETVNIGFSIMMNLGISRIGTKSGLAVHSALCDRLIHLKMSFFNKYTAGELLQKIKRLERMKKLFLEDNLKVIAYNVFMVVQVAVLFRYCAEITPYILIMFAGMFFIHVIVYVKKYKHNKKLIDIENRAATFTQQSIQGIHRVMASRAQERIYNIWNSLEMEKRNHRNRLKENDNVLESLWSAFVMFSPAVVYLLIMQAGVTMGAFIAYIATFFILQNTVKEFLKVLSTSPELISIYQNIKPILESEPEYGTFKSVPANISGTLEFNHVSFRYSEFGRTVVDDVSFSVSEGESLGILGPSGSGKSTILKLMIGLYGLTSGKIYYGGYDMETINTRYLRKNLGVVVQNGHLTIGDIYSNITADNVAMNEEQALELVKMVGLEETVVTLPDGLYTRLEDRNLSPGETQKILIARAIAKRGKFIFFDEATSNLDNDSQSRVFRTLQNIPATKIIIAQRVESVKTCDKIIVVDRGKIIRQGKYEEMVECA